MLAYRLAQGESETAWTSFLQGLYLRGLLGGGLRLVITDGSSGLAATVGLVYTTYLTLPTRRTPCSISKAGVVERYNPQVACLH